MCARSYYLSYSELLLLCELRKQDTYIFSNEGTSLVCKGSSLGHANSEIVLVVLQAPAGGGSARGRTHFQRLVRVRDLRQAQEQLQREAQAAKERADREREAERAARARETRDMANCDAESRAWNEAVARERERETRWKAAMPKADSGTFKKQLASGTRQLARRNYGACAEVMTKPRS